MGSATVVINSSSDNQGLCEEGKMEGAEGGREPEGGREGKGGMRTGRSSRRGIGERKRGWYGSRSVIPLGSVF